MDSKKLLLVGILVLAAGVAFVYFDPLELDLLGVKQKPAVARITAAPHLKSSVAVPPAPSVMVPKAPVTSTQSPTPAAKPPAPAASSAPKAVAAPVQQNKAEGATPAPPSKTTALSASAGDAAPVPDHPSQPPLRLSKTTKQASKPVRPKNLDLRHCLDLEDNAAIAKCAGE